MLYRGPIRTLPIRLFRHCCGRKAAYGHDRQLCRIDVFPQSRYRLSRSHRFYFFLHLGIPVICPVIEQIIGQSSCDPIVITATHLSTL